MKLLLQLLSFFFIFQTTCFLATKEPIECKINHQHPSKVFHTIVVSQSGNGKYSTIKQAIESIPLDNDKWVKIALSPGTYTEQVQIMEKQCIVLEGQDRSTTIIQFDAHSGTENSITFDVFAHNFVARGITFKNSYNLRYGAASKSTIPAVAFRGNGDKQAFFNCGFEGYQDTLWDSIGRHYYKSCYIEGAVDFIWGKGASVFQNCHINVTGDGYITAQGKDASDQLSGFVFNKCSVSGQGQTLLGRAYGAYATVIFINSNFGNIIKPEGWDIWRQISHRGHITFGEYNCKGPGADTSKRVPWSKTLSKSDVPAYATRAFIGQDGWIQKLP